MVTVKQGTKKRSNMVERAKELMEIHFPEMSKSIMVWKRSSNFGFTTIPRTLTIAMQAIDMQSKGTPGGHVLLCLWARAPDHALLSIDNPTTFAHESGFHGERALNTWRKRMKILRDLHFIETKPGATGEFHYVLLLNPNGAVERMRLENKIQDSIYSRFIERATEIGALPEIQSIREYLKEKSTKEKSADTKPAKKS
jgi:hypothetical protein